MIDCSKCEKPIFESDERVTWGGHTFHRWCWELGSTVGDPEEEHRINSRTPSDNGAFIPGTTRPRREE
jgi:hypothetical protein